MLGRTLLEVFPERYHGAIGVAVAAVTSGKHAVFEAANSPSMGPLIFWEAELVPFADATGAVTEFAGIFVNVTSQVKASERLKESEEHYRELVEGAHDLIQSVGSDGRYLFVNRAWRETLGYTPEEVATLRFSDVLGADQLEHCSAIFHRVMRGLAVDNLETVFVAKDGRRIYVEGNVSARLDGGIVGATQGIFRDITERKRAEEEIKTKASLLELSADAILLLSLDADFIYFNSALLKMTGYSREELLALKLHGLEPPGFAERIRPNIAMLLERGEAVFESAYVRKDGSVLPVEVHAIVTEFSGRQVIMSLVRDISERKAALDAVHSAEKRFRDLLESVKLAAVILDPTGAITYCNDFLLTLAGWSRDELLGRDWFETFIPAQNRDEVRSVFVSTLSRGVLPLHFENPILTRDGRLRQITWDNTVLHGPEGEVVGAASIGNDVTEQRQLEEQLRQSQKMEAIGQLAGGVAHDFNNMLTAINVYSDLLLNRMTEDDPRRLNVEHILQATERAATLTRSLLAFSRKQAINPKPHDLTAVVARLEKFLLRLIREDIEYARSADERTLTVFADASQLEQVLMNLVTNACDAMPRGGRLSIRTEFREIDPAFVAAHGFGRVGGFACITVSDTGHGMDRATCARVFEPFFTTKEAGKGTGLGLSMAYGIVRQHEGYIDVESAVGQGTTFRIFLPLFRGTVEEERQRVEPAPVEGGSETILVAEDDTVLRKLFATVLSNAGYRVLTAVDGEDAIRLYGESGGEIDLLLLDGIMPKKSGREALREIRLINPTARAVFMTGYSPDIIDQEGLIEAGLEVLFKPLSPSVMLKKVREVLDQGAQGG